MELLHTSTDAQLVLQNIAKVCFTNDLGDDSCFWYGLKCVQRVSRSMSTSKNDLVSTSVGVWEGGGISECIICYIKKGRLLGSQA